MDVVVPEASLTESLSEKSKETVSDGRAASAMPAAETKPERGTERQAEKKSELFYQKILSQVKSGSAAAAKGDADVRIDAKSIGEVGDADAQAAKLVDLAGTHGVAYAVKVARMLDFYILDKVHDQLANAFYDALVGKGMIEKE